MRILYDHQVFSLQDAGGASRYHFELIRNMQGAGEVAIDLLLGLNSSVMPFRSLQGGRTRVFGHSTAMRPGLPRYAVNELFSALIAPPRRTVDIYHPTLYRALPWVRRRRVVVTHHDCIHERFPGLFPNAASIVESKRKLFAKADAIICVSESSRKDLLHFYDLAEMKTHVVYHGFSPLPLPVDDGPELAEPYLLYVGSRTGYKNFGLLLEAFSRSGLAGNYRLLAVGGGPFTPAEQEKITSLKLGNSVSVVPKADDRTLARAYRDAALFVYPSLYEGFGFPPLEAMSLRCPVLVNQTSSLPEVCGNAAFYFETADPGEFSRRLTSILTDSGARSAKREMGAEQVRLYDWQRCARRTLEIYNAVLNQ
jgi:glycosyltransferase involved in cell wall biosynthesis